MADLHRCDLQGLGALPGVKQSELPVVTASHEQVGVLRVVLEAQHGRGGLQCVLRLVGVF